MGKNGQWVCAVREKSGEWGERLPDWFGNLPSLSCLYGVIGIVDCLGHKGCAEKKQEERGGKACIYIRKIRNGRQADAG